MTTWRQWLDNNYNNYSNDYSNNLTTTTWKKQWLWLDYDDNDNLMTTTTWHRLWWQQLDDDDLTTTTTTTMMTTTTTWQQWLDDNDDKDLTMATTTTWRQLDNDYNNNNLTATTWQQLRRLQWWQWQQLEDDDLLTTMRTTTWRWQWQLFWILLTRNGSQWRGSEKEMKWIWGALLRRERYSCRSYKSNTFINCELYHITRPQMTRIPKPSIRKVSPWCKDDADMPGVGTAGGLMTQWAKATNPPFGKDSKGSAWRSRFVSAPLPVCCRPWSSFSILQQFCCES